MKLISSFVKKWKVFFDGSVPDQRVDFLGNDDAIFNDSNYRIELLAYASVKFKEFNEDRMLTKNALTEFGLSEKQKDALIDDLIKWKEEDAKLEQLIEKKVEIQHLIADGKTAQAYDLALATFQQNKSDFDLLVNLVNLLIKQHKHQDALDLASSCYHDHPNDIRLIELLTQIVETFRTHEEVLAFIDTLKQMNPIESQNIEYRKGLYLKSKGMYAEAKTVFVNLTMERQFAWDYYQIAIMENLQGNENACLDLLEKTFSINKHLREDAKQYHELSNLPGKRRFIYLTT